MPLLSNNAPLCPIIVIMPKVVPPTMPPLPPPHPLRAIIMTFLWHLQSNNAPFSMKTVITIPFGTYTQSKFVPTEDTKTYTYLNPIPQQMEQPRPPLACEVSSHVPVMRCSDIMTLPVQGCWHPERGPVGWWPKVTGQEAYDFLLCHRFQQYQLSEDAYKVKRFANLEIWGKCPRCLVLMMPPADVVRGTWVTPPPPRL